MPAFSKGIFHFLSCRDIYLLHCFIDFSFRCLLMLLAISISIVIYVVGFIIVTDNFSPLFRLVSSYVSFHL